MYKFLVVISCLFFSKINILAQSLGINEIQQAYTQRLDNTPKEVTYIHSDKDIYFPGEEVLFKIYLLSFPIVDTNSISKVCYFYLCNAEGKIVQTQVLKVKDKSAFGVLSISKTISSGDYYLAATTMWMQNFDNSTCHFKKIRIVKSFEDKAQKPTVKTKDIEIGFFPESGNLMPEVNQKIGVRSLNENGESIDVQINIKNSNGEVLQTFNTGALGLTNFDINTEIKETYFAECVYKKENITKIINLPAADGISPNFTVNNQKKIFVQLNTSKKQENENYFIAGIMNKVLLFTEEFDAAKSANLIAINKTNLPTGLLTLHLINSKAQIIAERFIWVENNTDFIKPNLTFTKKINKKKRENGEIEIDFLKNIDANISISVSRKNLCDTNQLNIFQYTQLLTALGNSIDFNKAELTQILGNKNSFDDFLVVNGWRKFTPKSILKDDELKYTNENGIFIAGQITKAQTKTAVPNSKLDLFVLNQDSSKYIYSEPTNAKGEFIFRDLSITKNSNLFYTATNLLKTNALVDVTFYKHFTDTLKKLNVPKQFNPSKKYSTYYLDSMERSLNKYLEEVVVVGKRISEVQKFDEVYVSSLFENADQSIILKNELATSTIWQILQRNVSGISIVNSDSGILVYFNRYFGVDAFSENGLGTVQFFLNEQPVSQFEIEGLQPSDVAYIKVYKGGLGYVLGAPRGGIAFYTVKGKKTGDWRDKGFTKFEVQGYEPEYKVYSMLYSKENINNTNLDYRPTILWVPVKTLRQRQKFVASFFSDDYEKADWIIKVIGVTSNNIPIFAEKNIE